MHTTQPLVPTETEFTAPVVPTGTLTRPHITSRLRADEMRLLAMVAPAGYGKTTAVAQWVTSLDPTSQVAYLSVDERYSDPVRFWTCLSTCLNEFRSSIDGRPSADPRHDPRSSAEIAAVIVNELARLEGRQVIVLEDLHRIDNRQLLDAIFRFIVTLPANVTVAVTARTFPGWPLERLRARAEAAVVGPNELRFTRDETATLIHQVRGEVDRSVVDNIQTKTDGWPVLVQLMAARLADGHDPRRSGDGITETGRSMIGYLEREILSGLPPPLRRFLLDTAVVERFSVPLARAIVGPRSAELTKPLVARQLLVEVEDHPGWYAHHTALRNALLPMFRTDSPARFRLFNLRAGTWLRAHGETSQAIEHLIKARALTEAMALVDSVLEPDRAEGRAAAQQWFGLVPIADIERRPAAAARLSRALTSVRRFDEAAKCLDVAKYAVRHDADRFEHLIARIYLDRARGDVCAMLHQLTALDRLAVTTRDASVRATARTYQVAGLAIGASCHEILGNDDKRRALQARYQARRAQASPWFALSFAHIEARFHAEDGEIDSAERQAIDALVMAERRGDRLLHTSAHSYLALARIAWCRGRLGDAQAALDHAARLDRRQSTILSTLRAVCAAEIQSSVGAHERAEASLRSVFEDSIFGPVPEPNLIFTAGWGIWISVSQGRLPAARRWLASIEQRGSIDRLSPALWARAALLKDRADLVIARLGADGGGLPSQPLPRLRCGLVLHAALSAGGHRGRADALARQLLELSKRHGLVQPLIDEPGVLLGVAPDHGDHALDRFIGRIQRHNSIEAEPSAVSQNGGSVQGITRRELDVIGYLDSRLTNREIARELQISLNTVKSHLRTVYRKLDVGSRNEAIVRCRDLGLL